MFPSQLRCVHSTGRELSNVVLDMTPNAITPGWSVLLNHPEARSWSHLHLSHHCSLIIVQLARRANERLYGRRPRLDDAIERLRVAIGSASKRFIS